MDITTSLLKDWSTEVKNAYFDKGIEPSVTAKALVEKHDLNREQSKRLCEAANIEIKRALRKPKGPDDVQFPLASMHEVVSGSDDGDDMKEASLDPGASYLEKCASEFFDSRRVTSKSNSILDAEKLAMVAESLGQKASLAHRAVTMKVREFEKIAGSILEYLTDEARATGGVDESYTVVSACMNKRADLVDRFYKYADKVLEADLNGMTVKKASRLENPNWIPNPDSEIVCMFKKYASAYDAVVEARAQYDGVNKAKKDTESRLRQVILEGE